MAVPNILVAADWSDQVAEFLSDCIGCGHHACASAIYGAMTTILQTPGHHPESIPYAQVLDHRLLMVAQPCNPSVAMGYTTTPADPVAPSVPTAVRTSFLYKVPSSKLKKRLQ